MLLQDLSASDWTVRAVGDTTEVPGAVLGLTIAAIVPGCVHTDLIRAGIIGDPAIGFNELDMQWIGLTDWEYRTVFNADEALCSHDRLDLVFDGLDTVASVVLNTWPIGTAANMFHPHRFDVRGVLRRDVNELIVRFRAPMRHIREMEAKLGSRPVNGDWDPFIFIRKAACNFGWDWGPKVATVGLWRPVRIEAWSVARLCAVRPIITRGKGDDWSVRACCDFQWDDSNPAMPLSLSVTLDASPGTFSGTTPRRLSITKEILDRPTTMPAPELTISSPALWDWQDPAPLHPLRVRLWDPRTGIEFADETCLVGFRTVELDTAPDGEGSAFTLRLNGRPIFCIGANWIPEGLWPGQVTRETYRRRLDQARAAGINMLRVWGGGYYESDEFYSECDRRGILVWQDFMFSCAMYPEEDPFPSLVESEARHQIARLASHSSVALWCGGNECNWGYESWGWKERLKPGQSWGRGYYLDLLPRLVAELDPTRPYWANSPWSGSESIHPNDGRHGDRHTWDQRLEGYFNAPCRFLSEAGHQSPSCYSTLATALPASELALNSRALEHRQRGPGGNTKQYDEVLHAMFRPARTFDEWHAQAHLAQARAVRLAVDSALARFPACSGVLIWQLNDAWPGLSWSLVDSAGRAKPALSSLACHHRVFFHPGASGRHLSLACFAPVSEPASVHLARCSLDGRIVSEHARAIVMRPGTVTPLGASETLVGSIADPTAEFYLATLRRGGSVVDRAAWFALPERQLRLPEPSAEIEIQAGGEGPPRLAVRAVSLLHDAVLSGDRLHESLRFGAGGPRTLLPGEVWTLDETLPPIVHGTVPGWAESLCRPPYLWCANHFALGT